MAANVGKSLRYPNKQTGMPIAAVCAALGQPS
jgi:hypothetical protein